MKKILAACTAAFIAAGILSSCSSQASQINSKSQAEAPSSSIAVKETEQESPSPEKPSDNSNDKTYKIGIVQLVEHDALDASYRGFVDGLAEAGYYEGKNIVIDYQNAQGEQANCNTIATKLVNDKSDLILAIATPAAQAVANATKDIPILVTAVTDPAVSKLVVSNEAPGGNVTGTSDRTPNAEQIQLLTELIPTAETIGLLYCSSESNSKIQIDIAREEAEKLGLKTIEYTISDLNELQQVMESMVGKVDAIYTPTDNKIASGMATVSMIATENKIPVIAGEGGMVENGALASYGLDYYELGKLTANQAVKILKGGASPADMPIEYLGDFDFYSNDDVANQLGITIPEDLKK